MHSLASVTWLVYNIISGSIPGIATEVLLISSTVVALLRHRRQNIRMLN